MRSATLAKALLILLCFGSSALLGCGFGKRSDVLILVRAGDPTSISIGQYFASARSVPPRRILELPLSGNRAEIEIDTATYESEIAAPIENYLALEDPKGEVSILVTTLGIPLRIGHCKRNSAHYPRDCRMAAVDAALAGLGRIPPAQGLRPESANPYFGELQSFDRFRRNQPDATLRFLVARLTSAREPVDEDSNLPKAVLELIDHSEIIDVGASPLWRVLANAPQASRTAASAALFDPIEERLNAIGHRACDGCAAKANPSAAVGIVMQTIDHANSIGGESETLTKPGWVIALGGTTNLLDRDASSGNQQKEMHADPFEGLLTKLFSSGARIVSTHIEDPSLSGVTRPAIQIQAWISGRTAIEAHFASVPLLGWVNVFVGDPLIVIQEPARFDSDDRDGDQVPDDRDNCIDVANPDQRDSNNDRIGNRCDPDVDDDGRVATSWGQIYPFDTRGDIERIALTARNGPYNPDHDINGDGQVDENDVALAQLWLFRRPGPFAD